MHSVLFNAILNISIFPKIWKISQTIMIPKPGKDLTLTPSYRPISLFPCLSKIFEKIWSKYNPSSPILFPWKTQNYWPSQSYNWKTLLWHLFGHCTTLWQSMVQWSDQSLFITSARVATTNTTCTLFLCKTVLAIFF